ncbi:MAG: hypothetical protein M0R37_14920 [Bacteroidales bacterium]|jgi:hypothetical protein|nr:hypothetical protein [Bacteroidales bacterium]
MTNPTTAAPFAPPPSIKAQATERAELIRRLGWAPEARGVRYAATTGEMQAWLAGGEIPNYDHS